MTNEILNKLLENISDIELIKLINEQDDYIINNIVELFSTQNQETLVLGKITKEQVLTLIKKALLTNNNPRIFGVLRVLYNQDVILNRDYNQISSMCNYIFQLDENDLDLRIKVLTSKDINEYLTFKDQVSLLFSSAGSINSKLKLISTVIHNSKNFKGSILKNNVIKLIVDLKDDNRLMVMNSFLMDIDSHSLTTEDYYNIITTLSKPPKNKEHKDKEVLNKRSGNLYQELCDMRKRTYKKGILESFKAGSNIDINILKQIDACISEIDDDEILEIIYDVSSCDKLNEKLTKEEKTDIITLMSKLDKYNCKKIRKVFTNELVIKNREYNEMLDIVKEIFNCINYNQYIDVQEILLNKGILQYRTEKEAIYLLNKLKKCSTSESMYVMTKLIKLEGVIEKISFEEQKEEIDLITTIDNTELADMILTLLNNYRIIENRTFEERKEFVNKTLKQESMLKLKAVYEFLSTYAILGNLKFEQEMDLADYISNIPSNKIAYYVSSIFTNANLYENIDEEKLMSLLKPTATGIKKVDEIKKKIYLTERINSSSSIEELKNLVNPIKHYTV